MDEELCVHLLCIDSNWIKLTPGQLLIRRRLRPRPTRVREGAEPQRFISGHSGLSGQPSCT